MRHRALLWEGPFVIGPSAYLTGLAGSGLAGLAGSGLAGLAGSGLACLAGSGLNEARDDRVGVECFRAQAQWPWKPVHFFVRKKKKKERFVLYASVMQGVSLLL